MRLFVAVTDNDWFKLHASKSDVAEVNFWRPSPTATFVALERIAPVQVSLAGQLHYGRRVLHALPPATNQPGVGDVPGRKRSPVARGNAGASRALPTRVNRAKPESAHWLHHAG